MAGIAHELNQPLSAIVNYANGTRRRLDTGALEPADLKEPLRQITAQASRAGEIIRRFRALVSRQPTQRRNVSINDMVKEVLSFVDHILRKLGVVVETRLAAPAPRVRADLVQMEQVILNLVRNAIDAVKDNPPKRRQVWIRTRLSPLGQVQMAVTDNGPGLAPAAKQHLFEPFFTTKTEGMGMGLAISQTIAEDHGGRITVDDAPQGGAIFILELPAVLREQTTDR